MADVVTALSRAVQEAGHNVKVILPKYDVINYAEVGCYCHSAVLSHVLLLCYLLSLPYTLIVLNTAGGKRTVTCTMTCDLLTCLSPSVRGLQCGAVQHIP